MRSHGYSTILMNQESFGKFIEGNRLNVFFKRVSPSAPFIFIAVNGTLQKVKKNQIVRKCIACGNTSSVDLKHKLCTFIIKNPPPVEELPTGGAKAAEGTPAVNGRQPSPSEENAETDEVGLTFNAEVRLFYPFTA